MQDAYKCFKSAKSRHEIFRGIFVLYGFTKPVSRDKTCNVLHRKQLKHATRKPVVRGLHQVRL